MTSPVFAQPRIVTWVEFQRALLPRIQGYHWALDTLRDLWDTGTPTPNQVLHPDPLPSETRIIMPRQFAAWWGDVQQRMSIEQTPEQIIPKGRSWA